MINNTHDVKYLEFYTEKERIIWRHHLNLQSMNSFFSHLG